MGYDMTSLQTVPCNIAGLGGGGVELSLIGHLAYRYIRRKYRDISV